MTLDRNQDLRLARGLRFSTSLMLRSEPGARGAVWQREIGRCDLSSRTRSGHCVSGQEAGLTPEIITQLRVAVIDSGWIQVENNPPPRTPPPKNSSEAQAHLDESGGRFRLYVSKQWYSLVLTRLIDHTFHPGFIIEPETNL